MKKKVIYIITFIISIFFFICHCDALESSTLVSGPEFKTKLKNYIENRIEYSDSKPIYIVFGKHNAYSNIVDREWDDVDNISVSEDNHTKLFKGTYNNKTAIFVLTDKNIIKFNPDSSKMFDRTVTDQYGVGADNGLIESIIFNNIDTSNVTDMSDMFPGNRRLTSLDLRSFDTSKVLNMSGMFSLNPNLIELNISGFDTSKVTDMSFMFDKTGLTNLDVSHFKTSAVTNMMAMFRSNEKLTSLDLHSFDTSKVINMYHMFYECESLTSIDLSNFDTSNVTDMSEMFLGSINLQTIYVSTFNITQVSKYQKMFQGCISLVGGKGTKYNSSYVDKTYARVDEAPNKPGYFTKKETSTNPPVNSSVKGDWNNDNSFGITDITYYRKYLAGVEEAVSRRDNKKYASFDTSTKELLNYDNNTEITLVDLISARIELANE